MTWPLLDNIAVPATPVDSDLRSPDSPPGHRITRCTTVNNDSATCTKPGRSTDKRTTLPLQDLPALLVPCTYQLHMTYPTARTPYATPAFGLPVHAADTRHYRRYVYAHCLRLPGCYDTSPATRCWTTRNNALVNGGFLQFHSAPRGVLRYLVAEHDYQRMQFVLLNTAYIRLPANCNAHSYGSRTVTDDLAPSGYVPWLVRRHQQHRALPLDGQLNFTMLTLFILFPHSSTLVCRSISCRTTRSTLTGLLFPPPGTTLRCSSALYGSCARTCPAPTGLIGYRLVSAGPHWLLCLGLCCNVRRLVGSIGHTTTVQCCDTDTPASTMPRFRQLLLISTRRPFTLRTARPVLQHARLHA